MNPIKYFIINKLVETLLLHSLFFVHSSFCLFFVTRLKIHVKKNDGATVKKH